MQEAWWLLCGHVRFVLLVDVCWLCARLCVDVRLSKRIQTTPERTKSRLDNWRAIRKHEEF